MIIIYVVDIEKMNFNLIIFTEKTPSFYVEARKEYEKRLGRFCKLKITCVKNAGKLQKALNPKYPVIVIDNCGSAVSSEEVAGIISAAENSGTSAVNVVIGYDISVEEKEAIRYSVSQFDLSSDLTAVIALEQIYRAYKIISGETYHK